MDCHPSIKVRCGMAAAGMDSGAIITSTTEVSLVCSVGFPDHTHLLFYMFGNLIN